jgi:hypothetical protein
MHLQSNTAEGMNIARLGGSDRLCLKQLVRQIAISAGVGAGCSHSAVTFVKIHRDKTKIADLRNAGVVNQYVCLEKE